MSDDATPHENEIPWGKPLDDTHGQLPELVLRELLRAETLTECLTVLERSFTTARLCLSVALDLAREQERELADLRQQVTEAREMIARLTLAL